MPSRPIHQQATSGPDAKLESVIHTAEPTTSCQQPLLMSLMPLVVRKGQQGMTKAAAATCSEKRGFIFRYLEALSLLLLKHS